MPHESVCFLMHRMFVRCLLLGVSIILSTEVSSSTPTYCAEDFLVASAYFEVSDKDLISVMMSTAHVPWVSFTGFQSPQCVFLDGNGSAAFHQNQSVHPRRNQSEHTKRNRTDHGANSSNLTSKQPGKEEHPWLAGATCWKAPVLAVFTAVAAPKGAVGTVAML